MSDRVSPTAKQRRLAQLLVEGEMSIIEAYVQAYEQTPEQCKDRAKLANRAYAASKSKGVLHYIKKLQEAQAVEEARLLVWDKRKAARFLLRMCREVEVNIEITKRLRDKMLEEGLKTTNQLTQMLKVSQICNDTARAIKECIKEMNEMYGLTKPEVSLTNAVQVIIGSPDDLPDDTVDTQPTP